MKQIQLTQGKTAKVDDCDFDRLNQYKWYALKDGNTFYAVRHTPMVNGKRPLIQMHHEIIGFPPKGLMADHKDGNGLRNLRNNLRHVTRRQNHQNLKNIKTEKASKYPGVCWHKKSSKWHARIRINKKSKSLGLFTDEAEAFEAYKQAVESLGEKVIAGI